MFVSDSGEKELQFSSVSSEVLEQIVIYLRYHDGKEGLNSKKPLTTNQMKDNWKDEQDVFFIDKIGKHMDLLFSLLSAANYFNISCLMNLCLMKIACCIKGQSLSEMKKIFNQEK